MVGTRRGLRMSDQATLNASERYSVRNTVSGVGGLRNAARNFGTDWSVI
jgi:hypothetical protein